MVDYTVFGDVHESLNQEGTEELFNHIFHEEGFLEPDYILLHGGPDEKEEKQRFQAFEDFAQITENIPYLVTTPSYRKKVEGSERVTSSDFIYNPIQPESTYEEVVELEERLIADDKVVSVTNDYHVPRTESIMNEVLNSTEENNYLILGAEFDPVESEYREKWCSEFVRTVIPQELKDIGKKFL